MKRRVETTMVWNFEKMVGNLGGRAGVLTNLPSSRKEASLPRITEVSARSLNGGTEGVVCVQLDSGLEECEPFNETAAAVRRLMDQWYREHVTGGTGGMGHLFFQQNFELSRKESSFCEAAMGRVVAILHSLGVARQLIPDPEVTQSTYVWVPKKKGWVNADRSREFGWVPYGRWLANRLKLNEHSYSYPIYD